jgi:hypothetical protein
MIITYPLPKAFSGRRVPSFEDVKSICVQWARDNHRSRGGKVELTYVHVGSARPSIGLLKRWAMTVPRGLPTRNHRASVSSVYQDGVLWATYLTGLCILTRLLTARL